jgi:HlyD family secretion protein
MSNKFNHFLIGTAALILLESCGNNKNQFDASGSFEAVEHLISAEVSGRVNALQLEEGTVLDSGVAVLYIDTLQLVYRKRQLQAQLEALLRRKPDVSVQLSTLRQQLQTAESERDRVNKLVTGNAAPRKQLDDANAAIAVISRQIRAQESTLNGSSGGTDADARSFAAQIAQIDDQLSKCTIVNPVKGTVLAKYIEDFEIAAPGRPLYKIADLRTMTLRVYVSGDQLPAVKINQAVTVATDDGKGGFTERKGTISWISDKAEFTPKTVQTKDQRADMVYALKVRVPNDGTLKIGMYGQIKW